MAGPAYLHISWPGTLLGTILGRVSQEQSAPRNGVLLGRVCGINLLRTLRYSSQSPPRKKSLGTAPSYWKAMATAAYFQ